MSKPAVSIVVVAYESAEYIPALAASVKAQSYPVSEVVIVDNSPSDTTRSALAQHWPEARIVHQGKNLDWCKGANRGLAEARSPFIFLINPDVKLAHDAVERLMDVLVANPRIGAAAPKLRRLVDGPERILDGMGIVVARSRRFTNRGEGEPDEGQYDEREPFGFSGAATMYRAEALADIADHGGGGAEEYYDEDFVAYKDDVDVSYRLRHREWELALVPEAIAYHARTAQELKQTEGLRADRQAKSLRIRGNSWRNHLWTILKNEPLSSLVLHTPWIFGYEVLKFGYILFTEPSTLRILPSALTGLPRILKKRRAILTSSQISAKTLRKIISSS